MLAFRQMRHVRQPHRLAEANCINQMSLSTHSQMRNVSLSLPTRLWLWGIVLGLSGGLVIMQMALTRMQEASRLTWRTSLQQAETRKASTWKQIEKLYMAHRSAGSRLSRDDLKKQLTGEQVTASPTTNELIWTDSNSGLVVHFAFNEKGDWTGYQTNPGRAQPPQPPAPTDIERALGTTVATGGLVYSLSVWLPLWMMGLLATFISRRYRLISLELAALLGIVVCTGFWLDPDWPWTGAARQGAGSAVTAILTSCVIAIGLARQWKRRPRTIVSSPFCDTCGYDLTGNQSGTCPECGTPASFIVYKQILDQMLRERRDRARHEAEAKARLNPENHPH